MICLSIMFISWGLFQKAILPLWVPIVLTVIASLHVLLYAMRIIKNNNHLFSGV